MNLRVLNADCAAEVCLPTGDIEVAAVSRDGSTIAIGNTPSGMRLFRKDRETARIFALDVNHVAYSTFLGRGDRILATGNSRTIEVFDCVSGSHDRIESAHPFPITAVSAFNDDVLVTACAESHDHSSPSDIRLWDVHTKACLTTKDLPKSGRPISIACRDEQIVIGTSSGQIVAYNFRDGGCQTIAQSESSIHAVWPEPGTSNFLLGEVSGLFSRVELSGKVDAVGWLYGVVRLIAGNSRESMIALTITECFGLNLEADKLFAGTIPDQGLTARAVSRGGDWILLGSGSVAKVYNAERLFHWLSHPDS